MIADNLTRVLALREAGAVQRCHTLPHHGEYSNAHHTANALVLLFELYPTEPPMHLVTSLLYHDHAERWVGDLPSPALNRWPSLNRAYLEAEEDIHMSLLGFRPEADLEADEFIWLKAIDRLELLLWCHDQWNMGNKNVKEWITRLDKTLRSDITPMNIQLFLQNYQWRRTENNEV